MPLYEYHCAKCNKTSERYIPVATDEPQPCRICGNPITELKFSIYSPKIFEPYYTRNILPSGEAVKIESESHRNQLCRENNLTPAD